MTWADIGKTHKPEHLFDATPPFVPGHTPHRQPKSHILRDRHVWEQGIVLEDGGRGTPSRCLVGNVLSVHENMSTGRGRESPEDG
jgi:hypothetical protein